jgi:hypothetical protein
MTRLLGLTLAMVAVLVWPSTTQAQTAADPYRMEASAYGDDLDRVEPYGGFGLENVQNVPAGSVWMDRFGMLHGTPLVASAPGVTVTRPSARPSGLGTSGRVYRSRYQLPTGSLSWPGASGVIFYSPGMRYQTYGGGYGQGPYGSVDCGIMYKGMSLGY